VNAPLTRVGTSGLPLAAEPPCGLCGVADRMALAGDGARVSVAEMRDSLGPNAIAPLILLPALIAVSPLSAVFGVATVCGLWIALVAGSAVTGRQGGPVLPGPLLRVSFPRERLVRLRRWMLPVLSSLDARSRPRLRAMARWPLVRMSDLACLGLGLVMPLMEMVPMSATVAGLAVTLMAVGRIQEDGAMICAGLAAAALGLCLPFLVAAVVL
jgi:hypothetical protein